MGKYFEKTAISQAYVGKVIAGARRKLQPLMDYADRLTFGAGINPSKHVQANVDAATDVVASTAAKIDTTVDRISERFARRIDPAIKVRKLSPAAEKASAVFHSQLARGVRPKANA